MKKRLRFQMPYVLLKVLREKEDQVDIQDLYYERFPAPKTTTDDAEDDKDTDDDSSTSSVSRYDVTTDTGEVSEEGNIRYLGGDTNSLDTVIQLDNENQIHQNKNTQEYNTTGSVNREATDVQVAAQVHHLPDSDETSNDDTAPLLTNMQRLW